MPILCWSIAGTGADARRCTAPLWAARDAVALLLDRGADIHAFHGAGLGAGAGWWAQDVQAIDLAVWGGPPGLGPPRANHRHAQIATQLLERGAAYDLTIAAARGDWKRVPEILDENPETIREASRMGRLVYVRVREREARPACTTAHGGLQDAPGGNRLPMLPHGQRRDVGHVAR